MIENLSDRQLEARLAALEKMIASADPKDLPALNHTFQALLDEQVRRDLEGEAHDRAGI